MKILGKWVIFVGPYARKVAKSIFIFQGLSIDSIFDVISITLFAPVVFIFNLDEVSLKKLFPTMNI